MRRRSLLQSRDVGLMLIGDELNTVALDPWGRHHVGTPHVDVVSSSAAWMVRMKRSRSRGFARIA